MTITRSKRLALLLIVVVAVSVIVISYFLHSGVQPYSPAQWQEISGIIGIEVDYYSHRTVQSEADVEAVFNEYILYCQQNDLDIFGYGNNWRFENAKPYGLYNGVKYWKVSASWFDANAGVWRLKTVFCVSENGEVVRLLGAI